MTRQPDHGLVEVASDTRIGERALVYVGGPDPAVVAWADLAGPARRVAPRRWVCWAHFHHLAVPIDRDICRTIDPSAFGRLSMHRHLDASSGRELAELIGLDSEPTIDPHLGHAPVVAATLDWVAGSNDELWPNPADSLAAVVGHEPTWRRLGATRAPTSDPADPHTVHSGPVSMLAVPDLEPNVLAGPGMPRIVLVTRAVARSAVRQARSANVSAWTITRRGTVPMLRRLC